ncbi:MAG: UgpQ [Symbiobacteriaceae bacterium]|jgi:glycerophosphoryl diester phosphodiesterase|nr:UgpQ [Symbiobacteriaceae bacterium]
MYRRLAMLLVLLVMAAGCGGTAASNAPPRDVDVVAHRGGVPENTLSAFKAALADPDVDVIEMDVQVSKDGGLFIIHDKTVDRTTDGKGALSELTSEQVKALKTPKGGAESVPTLDEVLALLAGAPGKRAFVEIKNPTPADTPAKVLAALKQHGVVDRSVVISFDRPLLDEVKRLDPQQPVGFVSKAFGNLEKEYPSEYLLVTYGAANKALVAEAQKAGRKVYVWTVNEKPIMETYIKMGVDGIISDQYRLLVEAIR